MIWRSLGAVPVADPREDLLLSAEADAIQNALESSDPKIRSEWIDLSRIIQERRKISLDISKLSVDSDTAMMENRFGRTRFWATTLTPVLAVLITGATLLIQARQFRTSNDQQAKQYKATSDFQANQFKATNNLQVSQNADASWRELIKSVSFNDPKSALIGALAVEGFFDSPTYGSQSRSIATALLPVVDNVGGFDQIFDELRKRTNVRNQYELVSISTMISFRAREQHKLGATALTDGQNVPTFLLYDITSIDPNPDSKGKNQVMQDKVTSWELDSVSQGLARLWAHNNPQHLFPDPYLVSVVLEHACFRDLILRDARLGRSILYHADFSGTSFRGADLTNASIRDVKLDDVDLTGVEHFQGSSWQGSNWWNASRIPANLFRYLQLKYPPKKRVVPELHDLGDCK
jgi:hypothetical protein